MPFISGGASFGAEESRVSSIGEKAGVNAVAGLLTFFAGDESRSMLSKEAVEAAAGVEGSSRVWEAAVANALEAGEEQLR